MKHPDVRHMAEEALLVAVDTAPLPNPVIFNLEHLLAQAGFAVDREVVDKVGQYLARQGWAEVSLRSLRLQGPRATAKLTEEGYAAANDLIERNQPRSLLERLHAVNWGTWGAIVSILALVVSIIALFGSH